MTAPGLRSRRRPPAPRHLRTAPAAALRGLLALALLLAGLVAPTAAAPTSGALAVVLCSGETLRLGPDGAPAHHAEGHAPCHACCFGAPDLPAPPEAAPLAAAPRAPAPDGAEAPPRGPVARPQARAPPRPA
jgi:hypothetical protein